MIVETNVASKLRKEFQCKNIQMNDAFRKWQVGVSTVKEYIAWSLDMWRPLRKQF